MTEVEPFVFSGCLELRELTPYEAHDARELLEQLPRVPVQSIFCHTAAALLHRSVLPEAYPNDFALWTGNETGDRRLAERLAAIDVFPSSSMEGVREELVATIQDHLQHLQAAPPHTRSEPFRFVQIHLVPVPTGHQARTLAELRDAVAAVDVSAIFYHIIEARYHHGRGRGDFAEWVESALGRRDVAERLAHIDPYVGSLERLRDRNLSVLSWALEGKRD
ncbi:MAG TPA: DUF5752 family protein [Methylomirabilota bacterium]|jgi:hypothetical protein|nr:DUF5752 family protein [Methylomirabilota bacterium]